MSSEVATTPAVIVGDPAKLPSMFATRVATEYPVADVFTVVVGFD
jgi:hypothetical protein